MSRVATLAPPAGLRAPRLALPRLVPSRDDVLDAVVLLALTVLAMLGLRSSYGGYAWLAVGVLGALVGLLAAHLVLAADAAVGWLVLAAALLAMLFAGPVLPDTAVAGVLATPTTVQALVVGGLQGWADVLTVVPPVGSAFHLLALPYTAGLLATATGHWLARRVRWTWPPLVPVAALAAGSILVGTLEPAFPRLQGLLLPAAALGWAVLRRARPAAGAARLTREARRPAPLTRAWRKPLTALAVLAVAAGGGALVGPHLPGVADHERVVLREATTPPFDPHQFASPLGRFRRFVTDQEKARLFTVDGVPAGTRIRLAAMDTYDGLVWSVAGGAGPSAGSSGWFEKVGDTIPLPDLTTGTPATMRVSLEELSGIWLPDVGAVTSARFSGPRADGLAEAFRYNRATGTAVVPSGLQAGDSYDLDVVLPNLPTWDQLVRRQAERLDLTTPPVPAPVHEFASDTVENADDDTGRVLALQKALRLGYYSDGRTGQTPSPPGHSSWRLGKLLEFPDAMVGNDEQYAAVMALALQELRIRSRVVEGFVVRKREATGPQPVLGADAAAWVEVDVEGVGWVPVDPVPDENRKLDRNRLQQQRKQSQRSQPLPPPPVVAPAQEVQAGGQQRRGGADPDRQHGSWWHVVAVAALASSPLLVVLLVVGVVLALKRRRRRRRSRTGPPSTRVAGGWYEVLDLATDLGRPVAGPATRREAARSLGGGGVAVLASRADACVFGAGEPSEAEVAGFWADVDAHRAAALKAATWRRRWWARVSPASLWRGRRARGLRGLLPVPRSRRSQ